MKNATYRSEHIDKAIQYIDDRTEELLKLPQTCDIKTFIGYLQHVREIIILDLNGVNDNEM